MGAAMTSKVKSLSGMLEATVVDISVLIRLRYFPITIQSLVESIRFHPDVSINEFWFQTNPEAGASSDKPPVQVMHFCS
jgi:hypothetical protein